MEQKTGISAATFDVVVAGSVASAMRELFVAVPLELPLFKKTLTTVATFVPNALHLIFSINPPSAPAVYKVRVVPVPSYAVFAAVSCPNPFKGVCVKIGCIFAAINYIKKLLLIAHIMPTFTFDA